ncbi:carcinoembryonic antigen-related cell adhesion molecule 1-like [Mytilus californianus]|uniref:carcinoembryonic antigen-related cell adhesion molecule 1-like n=1 Tax=Mytilus californianus TaxID=6549 RepID=UPI002245488A|nr:carcinoembryonic antigen-related cell adhesion molecule 1-like [Mytilus californianus]
MATPIDDNPVAIVTGITQTFQCKTDAGRPSSRIQWYISDTNITSLATPQDDVCSLNCNGKVISSSVLIYTVNREDEGKIIYCTALNIENQSVGSQNKTVEILYGPDQVIISPSTQTYTVSEATERVGPITCSADCKPDYGPNQVNISPSTQTYTVSEATGRVGPITCSADCKPYCTMTWSGPNLPAGTTSVLNLSNIDRNQAGNYQCIGANIVGSLTSVTILIIVHYGPRKLNISPSTPIYTVTEKNESVGPIICSADCKPDCSVTWSGPHIANGTTSVMNLKHIAQNKAGNYQCSATNSVGSLTLVKVIVIFHYKPFLDHTRPFSPEFISATENNTLHITVTINANPTPTIEWTFKAETDMIPCNFSTILSNTSTNGFSSLSFILIDNVQYSNFGEYIISARNTIGVFYRRFIVMKEANLRQEIFAHTKENTGIFVAGLVTLVVGLLSLTTAIICIVRQRCKNKAPQSCKSDEYTNVQRSNPAFTDAYTTLQSDMETRPHQEQCGNIYDECRGRPGAYACSSSATNESEQKQHQEKGINTYEECGRIFDANSYDNLIK